MCFFAFVKLLLVLHAIAPAAAFFDDVIPDCYYNTDCTWAYQGQDQCFMQSVYTNSGESSSEAFCNDGSCVKKMPIDEACTNSGGNYDNNFCVTGLCSDSSGVCELRKSGCRSGRDCIETAFSWLGETISSAMDEVFTNTGYENAEVTGSCSATECSIEAAVDQLSTSIDLSGLEIALPGEGLTMTLAGSADVSMKADFNFDQKSPSLEATLDYLISTDLTATLAATQTGNWEVDSEYLLTNEKIACDNPSGTTCKPMSIYSTAKKIGLTSFVIDIGIQLTAYVEGKASAEGTLDTVIAFTSLVEDTATITLQPGKEEALKMDLGDTTPTLTAQMSSLAASAKASADLSVVFGVELTLSVNGIGAEFAVQSKMTMELDAVAASDSCVDGRAGITGGFDAGVHLPETNIGIPFSIPPPHPSFSLPHPPFVYKYLLLQAKQCFPLSSTASRVEQQRAGDDCYFRTIGRTMVATAVTDGCQLILTITMGHPATLTSLISMIALWTKRKLHGILIIYSRAFCRLLGAVSLRAPARL